MVEIETGYVEQEIVDKLKEDHRIEIATLNAMVNELKNENINKLKGMESSFRDYLDVVRQQRNSAIDQIADLTMKIQVMQKELQSKKKPLKTKPRG